MNAVAPRSTVLPAAVAETARAACEAVDSEGRFPGETLAELKAAGLLGAVVPVSLGGQGASTMRAAAQCQALARACASSAMILAMHHIQVACLVRHGGGGWFDGFLRRVASDQLLLASSTSEAGVGGALRTSLCAIERHQERFSLVKQASAISYGRYADAILATARRHPDASAGDQALAVVERADTVLEPRGTWNTMGMRGTATEPFTLTGRGAVQQILPDPFGDIAAQTMTPISHILWSAVWTGVAGDAVARARAFVRKVHDLESLTASPGALMLAEAVELLQMAEARLRQVINSFDAAGGQTPGFAEAAANNALKSSVSETCLAVVQKALTVCGFAGYGRSGPFSVERHIRDLSSAPLMVANARVRETSALLLLTQAPILGLDPGPDE